MTPNLLSLKNQARTVLTDPSAMLGYERDQCLIAENGKALAVVLADTVEEVVNVVRWCSDHAVPLVPRGAGTGLAGAANAIDGGVVLSVARLDTILAIDPIARTARVQPGVINGNLDRAARGHGLWYAPDPGSREISSIGGNLATNAGGMCCSKYGVTADHALRLKTVIGTGEVVETGSLTRKNVVGLDLRRLIIGSEGTLGVIVEATVRLRPRPALVATVAASFQSPESAIATVLESQQTGLEALAMEIMDRPTIAAVNALTRMDLDEAAGALLIAQFDGSEATAAALSFKEMSTANGAETFRTEDEDEGAAIMAARRAALPALERFGATILDDVAVQPHLLPALLDKIDRIRDESGVMIGTFGHAGDGNLHPTLVFDGSSAEQRARAETAFGQIVDAALGLGGTASGEHGVGSLKLPWLERQLGSAERDLHLRIKQAFDPAGILNPGRSY
ncbi:MULTISPECIES: FAD-linked oxidase C-terminal domain-containing protein [unclassified Nocardioides]|uniref:FAD-binding oxidoreductase n=1 Tax=unclassified Nocardioides TaxID=2615069 RepID=UPI000056F458|nr:MULTISPECIES: FAD-linked oxidase C-terminal domain-containing protein [unclassified Nocardioides]ABL81664.1 D-lactate dehydrogenase (cytochrome) [Nocardioides sp. JS614]